MPEKTPPSGEAIARETASHREAFLKAHGRAAEKVIAQKRYQAADRVAAACVMRDGTPRRTLTDRIDCFVCSRYAGPIVLAGILYGIYQLAIVQGYNLTNYWWPVLASVKNAILSLLPTEGLVFDPVIRSVVLWTVNGIIAVLNYVPIFAILFALLAILEDTGYMARVSFVLDRLFRPFGLHGQSALPLMLGGLFIGGCAIPGVMACRGIKDEKARMSTILVVPLMNCLAKIPFYLLLIGLFFTKVSGLIMFMMSTITLLFALSVSKVLSLTVLKNRPTAPFVLEMPVYHLPTVQNVARRVLERLWIFVKKIITVVAVVMLALYFLLNFPSLNTERKAYYTRQIDGLVGTFLEEIGPENPYGIFLSTSQQAADYAQFADAYRSVKRGAVTTTAKTAVDRAYLERNPEFFKVANKGKVTLSEDETDAFGYYFTTYQAAHRAYLTEYATVLPDYRPALKAAFYQSWQDADPFFFGIVRTGNITVSGSTLIDTSAVAANKAFQTVGRGTQKLRAERHQEQLEASLLGRLGIAVEPFTKLAGFNWRVNVGLIGAFAAKESVVATLGSIYQASGQSDDGTSLEQQISEQEKGWTPLHAVAMMLFMALYPPCVATLLMIKLQAGWRWMLFATVYPILLGLLVAILVFSGGSLLGLSGLGAMIAFYVVMIVVTVVLGFIQPRSRPTVSETRA